MLILCLDYDTDHGSVNVFPVDLTPQPTVEPMTTIGQCSRAAEGGPMTDIGHCSLQDMAELFQGYNRGHIYDGDGEPFVYDGDVNSFPILYCCSKSKQANAAFSRRQRRNLYTFGNV